MRALVTGADGFVGQWLVRALLDAGDDVAGTSHAATPALTTLEPAFADAVQWLRLDVRDPDAAARVVSAARPDAIYHLAAQSSAALSFDNPVDTFAVNVGGTLAMLEAGRTHAPNATLVFVGTSEVYGAVDEAELPITEQAPLRPHSPYAASKAAAEMYALQYARSGWLRAVAARPFNHTGPGQSETFVVPSFAKQIAAGGALTHGNLDAKRDFSDVRDVVRAYRALALRAKPATAYNVCSGHAVSMRELLAKLAAIAGRSDLTSQVDPSRLRPVDAPVVFGDRTAIMRDTGWRPTLALDQTLRDVYDWYARR